MSRVGIALGSNLGDRHAHIQRAFLFLRAISEGGHCLPSSIHETEPVDCPPGSEMFLNAVVEIEYTDTPENLFKRLRDFEFAQGRSPMSEVHAPRPIDLDILYFGDMRINDPDLIIPHPRITERAFVLSPLAEIRPDLRLAGCAKTVKELLDALG